MSLRWLHEGPDPRLTPKADALARAAAAGLPVPVGFAVALDASARGLDDAFARLHATAIVRSALAIEDGAETSGAGLGVSIAGVTDVRGCVAALAEIAAARTKPDPRDLAIVQAQIDARALLVLACEPGLDYVEVHDPGDALSSGATPRWSGPLMAWPDPARDALARLVANVRAAWGEARHGLDLEVVIARADDALALVQVRPLTAPLHPHWPELAAAIARQQPTPSLAGTLVLDAEHNPAPLSPAHADLVRWLGEQRSDAGGPVALAGWLYVRTLPRQLGGAATMRGDPIAVLRRLQGEVIPAARARLESIARACTDADADALVELLHRARAAFLAMIDVYLGELIPARRGWAELEGDVDDPLCLRARDEVLDVLPFAWDVASPTLGARGAARPVAIPDTPAAAATLLREWDDHLFALGIAPVRSVYLAAGQRLGLGDDVFLLGADELARALADRLPERDVLCAARRAAWIESARLVPPPRIIDGHPAGAAPRWLRGFAIGDDFTGPLAQRSDLADLRARPPRVHEIAVLPALTAPAAVVIAELGLTAVVCEHGGALSHAALIARELGLSALVGCRGCTRIADGVQARIDVRCGALRLVD